MNLTAWLIGLLVFGPLIGAALAAVIPRVGAALSLVCGSAVLIAGLRLAGTVSEHGPVAVQLGGWDQPVGIGLRMDGLSAVLVLTCAVIGLLVVVYATGSQRTQGNRFFFALWLALSAGLNAVFVAADLFNTYVALELVTVAAVGAVALGGRAAAGAALRYLLVAVAGSLWFLLAVALLYAQAGSLSLAQIAERAEGPHVAVALVIATVGLALKSALVPMHAWLPPAHAGAPSAVSPLMSALVIKASLFVLYRLWTTLPVDAALLAVSQAVGLLGCLAVVWGSVAALRQQRLKRVVAYSTVAQVGYLVLLIPLVAPALTDDALPLDRHVAELAVQGTVAFVVGHALAKTAMFAAAGCLLYSYGTDELSALRGAAATHRVPVFTFGVAGIALAGLPPAIAFTGKWQLLTAALVAGQWWWLPILLFGALLTAAYTVRVLAIVLAEPTEQPPRSGPPAPARMRYSALLAAMAAASLGVGFSAATTLSSVGLPVVTP
ncbi:complex I subunit 5 family protein [Mycobacterium sp. smrl_JER01]|uniref:complex I subunit 5 family protein n=1 Tax=Mycobacterium sp. smrl_JER01 TaxID=3402633 RepID=UPI003AC7705E